MNKEQAEIYVMKSLDMAKTISRDFQYKFLVINLFFLGIPIALYHELSFVIIISIIFCLNLLFVIIFAKKRPDFIKVTILIIIQLTVFCIGLNCIVLGLYKIVKKFKLWIFVFSIIIQIIAFILSFIIVKKHAVKFKPKNLNTGAVAGAAASFGCALGFLLVRFLSPTLSEFLPYISLIINILVCLISVGISGAFYRLYLIKKYGLIIEVEKELEEDF